ERRQMPQRGLHFGFGAARPYRPPLRETYTNSARSPRLIGWRGRGDAPTDACRKRQTAASLTPAGPNNSHNNFFVKIGKRATLARSTSRTARSSRGASRQGEG